MGLFIPFRKRGKQREAGSNQESDETPDLGAAVEPYTAGGRHLNNPTSAALGDDFQALKRQGGFATNSGPARAAGISNSVPERGTAGSARAPEDGRDGDR